MLPRLGEWLRVSIPVDSLSASESHVPEPLPPAMSSLVHLASVGCTNVIIFYVCHDLENMGKRSFSSLYIWVNSVALKFFIYRVLIL